MSTDHFVRFLAVDFHTVNIKILCFLLKKILSIFEHHFFLSQFYFIEKNLQNLTEKACILSHDAVVDVAALRSRHPIPSVFYRIASSEEKYQPLNSSINHRIRIFITFQEDIALYSSLNRRKTFILVRNRNENESFFQISRLTCVSICSPQQIGPVRWPDLLACSTGLVRLQGLDSCCT